MDNFITYFFSYVELSMLAVALFLSCISLVAHRKHTSPQHCASIAVMYILLFCSGLGFLWQAVFYAALPQTAAMVQGYLPSPFEWQVSAAYIGIAAVGMIGAFSTTRFRLAAILLTAAVMWGQAIARIYLGISTEIHHSLMNHLNITAHLVTPLLLIAFYHFSKQDSASPNTNTPTATVAA